MPTLEEDVQTWSGGATVTTIRRNPAQITVRPAAFVWALPDGIEWVEPSYADPWGAASPSHHVRRGTRDGYVTEFEGATIEALPAEPGESEALDWYAKWLTEMGRTWEQERARLRALLDQAT